MNQPTSLTDFASHFNNREKEFQASFAKVDRLKGALKHHESAKKWLGGMNDMIFSQNEELHNIEQKMKEQIDFFSDRVNHYSE